MVMIFIYITALAMVLYLLKLCTRTTKQRCFMLDKKIKIVNDLLESCNESIEFLNERKEIIEDALTSIKNHDRELTLLKLNKIKNNLDILEKEIQKSLSCYKG
jgi:hypothetical protein